MMALKVARAGLLQEPCDCPPEDCRRSGLVRASDGAVALRCRTCGGWWWE